ncbi:hypothetical protein TWF694_004501 [Orbilia ellipsospora]|uniref:Semialdehyde dehydrogenase NAD-binding domain-containing protein n=1 Tax=Orbilia ellipsospora TaxID=2528407 RepID=A0AAV9WVB2_9PEZI
MSSKKIFIIGASGYVGGTVLVDLLEQHPNLDITALVRSPSSAAKIQSAHPTVKTVIGDLDSSDILTSISAESDIILTAADADHPAHIKSIYAGMAQNKSGKKTYLIHTSGTGIFLDLSLKNAGEKSQSTISDRNWDDVADFQELWDLPEELLHRNVDVLVQSPPTDANPNINFALVIPPLIYGEGSGAVNRRSIQVPHLIKTIIKRGKGLRVGKGENLWSNVHVQDLSRLYISLLNDAITDGGKADWNKNGGIYFAENGIHVHHDIAERITKIAFEKGYIKNEGVDGLSVEEVKSFNPFGPLLWGTNSLSTATRARKVLGWKPREVSLEETLEDEVEVAFKSGEVIVPKA